MQRKISDLMPMVSIITPVYNRPEYLEEAVVSIQNQTYTNWEHIIIDDGSTNPLTQQILKKIACYPKVTILKKENAGLGAARNFAIERCTGEFILTLDDDDRWRNDFIEKSVNVFNNDPDVAVVTSWFLEFGFRKRLMKPLGGGIQNFLVHNNSTHAIFRKQDWITAGKYDETYFFQAYTDWDLWLRIAATGRKIDVIQEVCFFYRIHKNGSMLVDATQMHLDLYRFLIEKNIKIYNENVVDALCLVESKLLKAYQNTSLKNSLKRWIKKLNINKLSY